MSTRDLKIKGNILILSKMLEAIDTPVLDFWWRKP